ncbi:MAG: bifunctional riboflavin kinase/FAD synthetase [Bacilli bacterium]
MKVYRIDDYLNINIDIKNLSLVLVYFDGVHVGHVQLISFAKYNAPGPLGVLTFDKPLKSIEGNLSMVEDRIDIFKRIGVDYVFIINCDDNFKELSYIDFCEKVLKRFNPIRLYCGPDFKFGYEAKGNVNDLKARFNNVEVINFVNDYNHHKISSSDIKNLIKEGEVEEASKLLGRPYSITGTIFHGNSIGNTIGFPTANLKPFVGYVMPKIGVYITRSVIDGVRYTSITNVGNNPTIADKLPVTIETYVLDFNGDLYGKEMKLYFYKRLRDEIKFDSKDALIEELNKNTLEAIEFFR